MSKDDAPAEATRDDTAFERRKRLLRALCVLLGALVVIWGLAKAWAVHVAATGVS